MKKILTFMFVCFTLTSSIHANTKTTYAVNDRYDERSVENFNGIAVAGPINVVITLDGKESCRLEGDSKSLQTIITEVKGNVLIIRPQTSITSWSKKYEDTKITAYISASSLSSLTMSGSGSMIVNGKITTGNLTTTLSGSGSIKLAVDVDQYNCIISGSGILNISGNADNTKITLSSSGTFDGKKLAVNNLSSKTSGSGVINIKANESIKAFISGSGKINYSGNATVEKTIIGSGEVRKV